MDLHWHTSPICVNQWHQSSADSDCNLSLVVTSSSVQLSHTLVLGHLLLQDPKPGISFWLSLHVMESPFHWWNQQPASLSVIERSSTCFNMSTSILDDGSFLDTIAGCKQLRFPSLPHCSSYWRRSVGLPQQQHGLNHLFQNRFEIIFCFRDCTKQTLCSFVLICIMLWHIRNCRCCYCYYYQQ